MIEKALREVLEEEINPLEDETMIVEERKLQVLVVDDDIYCSHIFTRQLIEYNFPQFHVAYSGFEVYYNICIYIYIYTSRPLIISKILCSLIPNICLLFFLILTYKIQQDQNLLPSSHL